MKHINLYEGFTLDRNPISNYDPRNYDLSVDMGYQDSTSEFMDDLDQICKDYFLKIVGFIPKGKAGGAPEITFRGSLGSLEDMIQSKGFEDVKYIMSRAKVVEP